MKHLLLFGSLAMSILLATPTKAGARGGHSASSSARGAPMGSRFSPSMARSSGPMRHPMPPTYAGKRQFSPGAVRASNSIRRPLPRTFAGKSQISSNGTRTSARIDRANSAKRLANNDAALSRNGKANGHGNGNGNGHGHGNGNGNHHHHCHQKIFFIGGFGYPFWWWDYPYYSWYPYPYYDDGQAVYEGEGYAGNGDSGDSVIAQVQDHLARAGYYRGAIDGIAGPATERAIRNYERAHHLVADGAIDDQLLEKMNLL